MAAANNNSGKAPVKMNMTERKELRKLAEERYDLLAKRLDATENHIKNAIEERLSEDAQTHIEAAKEAAEEIREVFEEAERTAQRMIEAAAKEANKKYKELMKANAKKGIEPDFGRRGFRGFDESDEMHYIEWEVADLHEKVEREFNKVRATKGDAHTTLMEQRNELLTKITLGMFQSEEALNLLEQIPTLENFITIPEGMEAPAIDRR